MDTDNLLYEQEKIKETLASPGMKFIIRRLRKRMQKEAHICLTVDPMEYPEVIKEAQLMRKLINVELPATIEWIINYQPDAPDKQVSPKKKWIFIEWMKELFKTAKAGKG